MKLNQTVSPIMTTSQKSLPRGMGIQIAIALIALFPLAYMLLPQPVGRIQAGQELAKGRIKLVELVAPPPPGFGHHNRFFYHSPSRWKWDSRYPNIPLVYFVEYWPSYATIKYAKGFNQVMVDHLERHPELLLAPDEDESLSSSEDGGE